MTLFYGTFTGNNIEKCILKSVLKVFKPAQILK